VPVSSCALGVNYLSEVDLEKERATAVEEALYDCCCPIAEGSAWKYLAPPQSRGHQKELL